jgi:molybdopterin-guanine dinucleotide biosynthesis protein A
MRTSERSRTERFQLEFSNVSRALVVGLFVGGRGSRFGGIAKGNLRDPNGVRLIDRLIGVAKSALPEAPVVLVGQRAEHAELGLPTLSDAPALIGPLGGLRALVGFARDSRLEGAVALACDMPYVTSELVRRLADELPEALALAPRVNGRWEPLVARYSIEALSAIDAAIEASEHSLQKLFDRLGDRARALPVADVELRALHDWDGPDDLAS